MWFFSTFVEKSLIIDECYGESIRIPLAKARAQNHPDTDL